DGVEPVRRERQVGGVERGAVTRSDAEGADRNADVPGRPGPAHLEIARAAPQIFLVAPEQEDVVPVLHQSSRQRPAHPAGGAHDDDLHSEALPARWLRASRLARVGWLRVAVTMM